MHNNQVKKSRLTILRTNYFKVRQFKARTFSRQKLIFILQLQMDWVQYFARINLHTSKNSNI